MTDNLKTRIAEAIRKHWVKLGDGCNSDQYQAAQAVLDIVEPMIPKWLPIESAPKPSGSVILLGKTKHANWPHVGQGHWYRPCNRWEWHHYLADEPTQPTHWQPLPTPPEKE